MMTNIMTKSRVSGFSRGTSRAYVQLNKSPKVVAVCFQAVAKRSRRVRRHFVCGSREISLVPFQTS